MFNKLPMNLQFFAEGSPAPETGAPAGAETTDTEQQEQPQEGSQRTFTQEEVDKMVQKRMARYDRDHQKEVDDARSEATRLAKMNKDQQKDYKLQQAEQAREEALSKLARYEMRDTARQQLIDGGYKNPTDEDIDLIVTEKAETTKANGEAFLKAVERIRQSVRDELLKGDTPQLSGTKIKVPTLDEFKKMSYAERVDLKTKNPQVYDKLVQESYQEVIKYGK